MYISRALVVGDRTYTEEELLGEGRAFIVLAEPGAGKTELLKRLATLLQATPIRASIFRNKPGAASGTGPLVIDAMDEVARIDEEATDQIIAMASAATAATVIFASRSGEWDNAQTRYVEQCFDVEPIIVRLRPFDEDEQRRLFEAQFPGESFENFAAEVQRFELAPLLGNPQFLQLLGEAYVESGRVFTSKSKIFADAVARLAHEANADRGRQTSRPPANEIAALGGEVFAKLLLSGATGVAVVEALSDRDFPYVSAICRGNPQCDHLVDTRLLKPSDDADKHEPVHRIVAEYCAARYLVERVQAPSDRLSLNRILSVVAPNGVVRDELRGMLGWIAALGQESIQLTAIKLDPYAVLANGDPSQLTSRAKRELIAALDRLADDDPLFRRSDHWRRFNVGQFFTPDILDQLRATLGKQSSLRNLVLELLIGSEAAARLQLELVGLMKSPSTDGDVRALAVEALQSVPSYDPVTDFDDLLAEETAVSLEAAARWVTKRGVDTFGATRVGLLLRKLSGLYPPPDKRHRDGQSRYFIDLLIRSLGAEHVPIFLDMLSVGLTCTCNPKHEFRCTCRYGISKIIGRLLDRYFAESPSSSPETARIWEWVKALHFQSSATSDRSAAVKYLDENTELRRSLQRLAVEGVRGAEEPWKAVYRLHSGHAHSGLRMHEGDREALSLFAFEHGLVDLWTALLVGHNIWSDVKGSTPLRAEQRKQSRSSPEFLAAWSKRERARRKYSREERKVGRVRLRRKREQSEAEIEASNRAHLRANLGPIEAGQHWWWLKRFATYYLMKPDELNDLVDDPETPERALRNCFTLLDAHIPTIEGLGRRERPDVAEVVLAGCVVRYRDGESLDGLDPKFLAAAKSEASPSYPKFKEGEGERFEAALDAALFKAPGDAEAYIRHYIEQQLAETENFPQHVYWLDQKAAFQEFRATLPLEWLERFPQMPTEALQTLFTMAAKYGSRVELLALIDRRLADPVVDSGTDSEDDKRARARKRFWQLNAFLYHSPNADQAWQELRTDPKVIFSLEHRLGRLYDRDDSDHAPVTAENVFQVLDAFVEAWPQVPLPTSWGTGDPEEETAYRFLQDIVWKIAGDTPDRSIAVLDRMIGDPRFQSFKNAMLTMRAEAVRKLALQDFRAPHPSDIANLMDANEVASVEDLRALMVEELGQVQQWLDGAETDPLDAFFDGGRHVDENTARNRIVDQLQGRMKALGLSVVIERHMSRSNRCDITASATIEGTSRLLVCEVKGQWNSELYTAASAQLDQRYAVHPDAAKQGVYLALWFGNGEAVASVQDPTITSASELQQKIVETMPEELRKRVDVVVLDFSRKKPAAKKATTKKRATKKGKPQ